MTESNEITTKEDLRHEFIKSDATWRIVQFATFFIVIATGWVYLATMPTLIIIGILWLIFMEIMRLGISTRGQMRHKLLKEMD